MWARIKKCNKYAYKFNENLELEIYSKIGDEKSSYRTYSEWHNYVCAKYGGGKYTETTLKNFLHYLKREKNLVTSKKEIWNGCTVPLLTVIIAIIYTFMFSVVNVINTYNNSINTVISDDFLQYTGYNAEMIYMALEQNLYSGMRFYFWGTIIMILTVFVFLCFSSSRIRNNNLKDAFFTDYIMIIQEIIEDQQPANRRTL